MIKSYKNDGYEMFCDKPNCTNSERFPLGTSFIMMVKEATTNGWKMSQAGGRWDAMKQKRAGGQWTHICPLCRGSSL